MLEQLGLRHMLFDRIWSGYGCRRGGINAFLQIARAQGMRGIDLLAYVMRRGRWKSHSSLQRYLLDVDPELAALLQLLQSQRFGRPGVPGASRARSQ